MHRWIVREEEDTEPYRTDPVGPLFESVEPSCKAPWIKDSDRHNDQAPDRNKQEEVRK